MSQADSEQMVAYLQHYVGRYGLQYARDQLLGVGHDPALIDRAIAEYHRRLAERPAPASPPELPPQEPALPAPRFDPPAKPEEKSLGDTLLLVGCGIVLGILALIPLLGGLCFYVLD